MLLDHTYSNKHLCCGGGTISYHTWPFYLNSPQDFSSHCITTMSSNTPITTVRNKLAGVLFSELKDQCRDTGLAVNRLRIFVRDLETEISKNDDQALQIVLDKTKTVFAELEDGTQLLLDKARNLKGKL